MKLPDGRKRGYLKEQLEIADFLNPYDNIRAGMFIFTFPMA